MPFVIWAAIEKRPEPKIYNLELNPDSGALAMKINQEIVAVFSKEAAMDMAKRIIACEEPLGTKGKQG